MSCSINADFSHDLSFFQGDKSTAAGEEIGRNRKRGRDGEA